MTEKKSLMRGMTVIVLFAILSGCDSALPDQETARDSVPLKNTKTVEATFATTNEWETVAGTWSAEMSGDQKVLKQSATDQPYPVTLLRDPEFSDVDVTVEFRPVSGKVDASGGIIFRAQDGENYFIVRANSLEDNFRLYATVSGSRNQIASTKIEAPEIGQWHMLRVVAVGDHIQAYLNGKLLIDHHDSRFPTGRIGLWTKADAVTEFTNFKASGTVTGSSD